MNQGPMISMPRYPEAPNTDVVALSRLVPINALVSADVASTIARLVWKREEPE